MSSRTAVLLVLLACACQRSTPSAGPVAGAWVAMLESSGTVENSALALTPAGDLVAVAAVQLADDSGTLVVRVGEARRELPVASGPKTGGMVPEIVARLGPGGELRGLHALELGAFVLAAGGLADGGLAAIGTYDAAVGMATIAAGAAGSGGAYVARVDAAAQPAWVRPIAGRGAVPMAVTGTPDGGVAVAGYFGEEVAIAGSRLAAPAGGSPLFVASFAADGQLRWLRGAESGQVVPALIGAAADGSLRVVGGCDGRAVLRGASTTRTVECGTPGQVFAAAFTADGEPAWFTGLPGKVDAMNLRGVVLADGEIAIAGAFGEAIGGGGFPEVSATPGMDGFVARIDAAGAPKWLRHIRGPGVDLVRSIAADADGSLWVLAITGEDAEIVEETGTRRVDGALLLQLDAMGVLARMTRLGDVLRPSGEQITGLSPYRVAVGGGVVRLAGTVFGEVALRVGGSHVALSAPTEMMRGSGFVVGFPVEAVPPP